ncbi:MAG: helix-turn-helix transcriptional regulator [Bacteroidota bacterium]|nr:helix-turn-helix transcriptional regulator [Bacteroidota bacterium]
MKPNEQIACIQGFDNGWKSYVYIISSASVAVLQFFYLLDAFLKSKQIVSNCKHATDQERRCLFFVYHFTLLLFGLFLIQLPLYLIFNHNIVNGLYVPFKGVLIFCFVFYKMFQEPDIFVPIEDKLPETIPNSIVKDKKASDLLNPQVGVSPEVLDAIYLELQRIMINEKLFLDSEISLSSLADRLKVCTHKLSLSINARSGRNFFNYVNSFRIEEAKRLLAESDKKSFSIEDIAFMSGFNSRAAFYGAFKRQLNQTPTEYITQLSKNTETDKI